MNMIMEKLEKSRSSFALQPSTYFQDAGVNKKASAGRLTVQPGISAKQLDGARRLSIRKSAKIEFRNRPRFDRPSSTDFKGKLDLKALARR